MKVKIRVIVSFKRVYRYFSAEVLSDKNERTTLNSDLIKQTELIIIIIIIRSSTY